MKKLCYIEVVLNKDDVSERTKKTTADTKADNKKVKTKNAQTNKNTKNSEKADKELKLNRTETLNYSTHTHKSLKEIENTEKTGEN